MSTSGNKITRLSVGMGSAKSNETRYIGMVMSEFWYVTIYILPVHGYFMYTPLLMIAVTVRVHIIST